MRSYLQTLHLRSDNHKKKFALAVSGAITLSIFAIWSLSTFGANGTLAQNNVEAERAHPEISPLDSLKANALSGASTIKDSLNSLKAPIESVDLRSQINYGQE